MPKFNRFKTTTQIQNFKPSLFENDWSCDKCFYEKYIYKKKGLKKKHTKIIIDFIMTLRFCLRTIFENNFILFKKKNIFNIRKTILYNHLATTNTE